MRLSPPRLSRSAGAGVLGAVPRVTLGIRWALPRPAELEHASAAGAAKREAPAKLPSLVARVAAPVTSGQNVELLGFLPSS